MTLLVLLAAGSDVVEVVAPNVVRVAHWKRLRDGELYAVTPRLSWSLLMRRTFDVDVMACVRCGGRLKVRAVVMAAASTARILESLARARAPPQAA